MEEREKKYLVWINNFIVNENNNEYDFLEEMHPSIKELYNMRDEIRKNANGILSKEDIKNRKELENKIINELTKNNLPEYILLKEKEEDIVEVLSGEKIDLTNTILNLRQMENKDLIEEYINSLTIGIVDSLNDEMPKFKRKLKDK